MIPEQEADLYAQYRSKLDNLEIKEIYTNRKSSPFPQKELNDMPSVTQKLQTKTLVEQLKEMQSMDLVGAYDDGGDLYDVDGPDDDNISDTVPDLRLRKLNIDPVEIMAIGKELEDELADSFKTDIENKRNTENDRKAREVSKAKDDKLSQVFDKILGGNQS